MANKRELLKEFGPKIIEVYGEEELKWIKENFGSDELEKYIKEDHDSFRGYRRGKTKLTRRKTMPQGKGTYGSKVGRPKKMTTARKTGGVTTAKKGKTKFKGGTSKRLRSLAAQTSMPMRLPGLRVVKPKSSRTKK